jgi:transcriptional regulator with XRE-family HTH domain
MGKTDKRFIRAFDQAMLRAEFVSLFWVAITMRRNREKFPLEKLAKMLGKNKGEVSRWFSSRHPNWTVDTIARITNALDIELRLEAIDRQTGVVFTASGEKSPIVAFSGGNAPFASRQFGVGDWKEWSKVAQSPASSEPKHQMAM